MDNEVFCLQFIVKYGKCGLVNIERFFLGNEFRKGFLFKLIRPVISYKHNPFYSQYFKLLLVYIFILYVQTDQMGCPINLFKEFSDVFILLKQIFIK